jgi:hypothetical protein
MDTAVSVELFVEILNRYVYYFEQENDAVSFSTLISWVPTSFRFQAWCTDEVTTAGHNKILEWPDRTHSLKLKL